MVCQLFIPGFTSEWPRLADHPRQPSYIFLCFYHPCLGPHWHHPQCFPAYIRPNHGNLAETLSVAVNKVSLYHSLAARQLVYLAQQLRLFRQCNCVYSNFKLRVKTALVIAVGFQLTTSKPNEMGIALWQRFDFYCNFFCPLAQLFLGCS